MYLLGGDDNSLLFLIFTSSSFVFLVTGLCHDILDSIHSLHSYHPLAYLLHPSYISHRAALYSINLTPDKRLCFQKNVSPCANPEAFILPNYPETTTNTSFSSSARVLRDKDYLPCSTTRLQLEHLYSRPRRTIQRAIHKKTSHAISISLPLLSSHFLFVAASAPFDGLAADQQWQQSCHACLSFQLELQHHLLLLLLLHLHTSPSTLPSRAHQ